ncbi:MAG: YchJ family protein [Desulfobacterium sp.]|nr:YchJ family protein [Desulfobacterium sp.]
MRPCPCCSNLPFDQCCEPLIRGTIAATTAEQVMRSRYTAYTEGEIAYLKTTTHPDGLADFDEQATRSWSEGSLWKGLEIIATEGGGPGDDQGIVEFLARFTQKDVEHKHHERAIFKREGREWLFLDGNPVKPKPVKNSSPKVGRNDPCPCNSGKKYKKCCGA